MHHENRAGSALHLPVLLTHRLPRVGSTNYKFLNYDEFHRFEASFRNAKEPLFVHENARKQNFSDLNSTRINSMHALLALANSPSDPILADKSFSQLWSDDLDCVPLVNPEHIFAPQFYPFMAILDEYGYYATPSLNALFASASRMGLAMVQTVGQNKRQQQTK